MKKIFVVIFLFLSAFSQAQKWKLVWSDEFDKTGLPDTTKWIHETNAFRNNELQYYTFQQAEN